MSYKVKLDPTFPLGEPVTGPLCFHGGQAITCANDFTICIGTGILICRWVPGGPGIICLNAWVASCVVDYAVCLAKAGVHCGSNTQWTTGPKDPNEKLVIAKKFIQPDQLLVYPIHFENVGDIEALDVFITVVLYPNLDVSTVELLTPDGSSFDIATRTVKWDLLGRNLQPSETGNVLLSVRPLPNLPSGIEIRNAAAI